MLLSAIEKPVSVNFKIKLNHTIFRTKLLYKNKSVVGVTFLRTEHRFNSISGGCPI